MRRRIVIGGAALLVIVVLVLAFQGKIFHRADPVLVFGTIEATEVDVRPKVSGRIEELPVEEGDQLPRGALIAQLEKSEYEAQLRLAEAEFRIAEAKLEELLAGSRSEEIKMAQAAVQESRASLKNLKANWDRIEKLHREGLASEETYDRAKAEYESAVAREKEAVEKLALLEAGPRSQQIKAARAELSRAEANLDLAKLRLADTTVVSPLAGTVLLKIMEEGELATTALPIATLGDLENLWVTVYIPEPHLGRITLSQPAQVFVDSYPGTPYEGRVIQISDRAEFTPKNVQTQEERTKLVFAVKVAVKNRNGQLKPGMPADVKLLFEDKEE